MSSAPAAAGGAAAAAGGDPPGPYPLVDEVIVYLAGQPGVIVDLRPEHMRKGTYADLCTELTTVHGIDMTNRRIVDEFDEEQPGEQTLAYFVPVNGLAAKDLELIRVEHAGYQYEERYLHNSAKSTIGWLKGMLEPQRAHGDAFTSLELTWKGVPQDNNQRIDQLPGLATAADTGLCLVGHKTIMVLDLDLGEQLQAELPRVKDSDTVRDILIAYQTQQRRNYLHQPVVARWTEELTPEGLEGLSPDEQLAQPCTVWEAQLPANVVLALKTQMFEVIIKEQADIDRARQGQRAIARGAGAGAAASAAAAAAAEVPGVKLLVFDWWRVRQVKEAYSLQVTESLGSSDQLLLDTLSASGDARAYEGELEEQDRLYKYNVREGSTLLVKREDFTQPTCMYTCADCGSDVRLKQRDAVRCRECGHRIVFKKRIQKPAQYLCR